MDLKHFLVVLQSKDIGYFVLLHLIENVLILRYDFMRIIVFYYLEIGV